MLISKYYVVRVFPSVVRSTEKAESGKRKAEKRNTANHASLVCWKSWLPCRVAERSEAASERDTQTTQRLSHDIRAD